MFDDIPPHQRLRNAWESVRIVRPVHYSLFTFGETVLPYYVVCETTTGTPVTAIKGDVRVTRPLIITPENAQPELRDFFENLEDEEMMRFLMARSAAFSHLQFHNDAGKPFVVSDQLEEAVAKLNRQLDDLEEDHVAIITAPQPLLRLAPLKYALERILQSAPDNIQELRERGFLP